MSSTNRSSEDLQRDQARIAARRTEKFSGKQLPIVPLNRTLHRDLSNFVQFIR